MRQAPLVPRVHSVTPARFQGAFSIELEIRLRAEQVAVRVHHPGLEASCPQRSGASMAAIERGDTGLVQLARGQRRFSDASAPTGWLLVGMPARERRPSLAALSPSRRREAAVIVEFDGPCFMMLH